MKNNEPLFTSIFDFIEERAENPSIFEWRHDESLSKFNSEHFVYEGSLITLEEDPPKPKLRRYVLTHLALIRYKVLLQTSYPLEIASRNSKNGPKAEKPENREGREQKQQLVFLH